MIKYDTTQKNIILAGNARVLMAESAFLVGNLIEQICVDNKNKFNNLVDLFADTVKLVGPPRLGEKENSIEELNNKIIDLVAELSKRKGEKI